MKLLSLFFIFLLVLPAGAGSRQFESGPEKTTLVELYSSEGCSSCPPADDWIRRLRSDPYLWSEIVPVVFHVTYWDYIGWKDPFADKLFTERQKTYASFWKDTGLYTPCVVTGGYPLADWYRRDTVPPASTQKTGILKIQSLDTNKYKVVFIPPESGKVSTSVQAHMALLGFDIVSEVTRGENSGRILKHDFIALDFDQAQMTRKNCHYETTLIVDDSGHHNPSRYGLAAWITYGDKPVPVQATGGYLE